MLNITIDTFILFYMPTSRKKSKDISFTINDQYGQALAKCSLYSCPLWNSQWRFNECFEITLSTLNLAAPQCTLNRKSNAFNSGPN